MNREQGAYKLLEALLNPIVYHPGGWGDTLPSWMLSAILAERVDSALDENASGTDAECCAYLYTTCLCFPLNEDWAKIYFYVTGRTMMRWKNVQIPDDMRVEGLSNYRLGLLDKLKRDIFDSRQKHSKEVMRKYKRPRNKG